MIIVPDASVLLKLVLEVGDMDEQDALAFIHGYTNERFEIVVPTLWRYEVGNVLGLKLPAAAKDSMDALLAYDFPEEPLDQEYCKDVLDLMRELKAVTFYDAAYHALAIRQDGTLLTADTRYARRASHKGHIALLSEWSVR